MNTMREEFEAWAANEFGWGNIEFRRFADDSYLGIHAHTAWQAWQAARQPATMADALAAGDGTLHGAIDHWQERALRAESELAARQPMGGVHPLVYGIRVKGNSAIVGVLPIKLKDFPVTNAEWDKRYEEIPLYAAPPQQPERVDCGWIIEQIAQQWDGCNYDAVGETIDVGEAIRMTSQRLINQQESKP